MVLNSNSSEASLYPGGTKVYEALQAPDADNRRHQPSSQAEKRSGNIIPAKLCYLQVNNTETMYNLSMQPCPSSLLQCKSSVLPGLLLNLLMPAPTESKQTGPARRIQLPGPCRLKQPCV